MKPLKTILRMLLIIGLASHFHAQAETVLLQFSAKEYQGVQVVTLNHQNETVSSENLQRVLSTKDTACICEQDYVIDSMLKIIEAYPYLNDAYKAAQTLIKNEAALKDDQRAKILNWLGLDAWNMQDIRKRIRRLKWQRVTYAAGGFVVGVGAGVYMIFKIVKP